MTRLVALVGLLATLALPLPAQPMRDLDTLDLGELELLLRAGELDQWEEPAMRSGSALGAFLLRFGADPGVGFRLEPGTESCWVHAGEWFPIDLSARPWGPSGVGPFDLEAYRTRYHSGIHPPYKACGAWSDLTWTANGGALRGAYEGKCRAIRLDRNACGPGGCDGNPTEEEIFDLATTQRQCGTVYHECWWATRPGGLPDHPVVVDRESWALHGSVLREAGVCATGSVQVWSSYCGTWPIFYRVDFLPEERPWCGAVPTGGEPPPVRTRTETGERAYEPGVPSTGRLQMELVPEEAGPPPR